MSCFTDIEKVFEDFNNKVLLDSVKSPGLRNELSKVPARMIKDDFFRVFGNRDKVKGIILMAVF